MINLIFVGIQLLLSYMNYNQWKQTKNGPNLWVSGFCAAGALFSLMHV